jgi:hypothetical protein
MIGIGFGVTTVLVVAALIVAAGAFVGWRRRPVPADEAPVKRSRHPLALVAAAAGGAILAIELLAAVFTSIGYQWSPNLDLLTAWLPRAATIYYTGGLDPSVWQSFLAPWYPPLAPVMDAQTFAFAGGYHPSVLPFQQVLLGIAFVLAVIGLLDRYAPRWVTLPALALLVTTPWFWWRLHSVLPDQELSYLLAGAALACVLWLHGRRGGWLGVAVVLLMAAALTKLEGALFGAVLVAAVVVAGLVLYRRAGLPALVLLLGPAAMIPWHVWLTGNQVSSSTADYNAGHALSPTFLANRFSRLSDALDFMLKAPFQNERLTAVVIVLSIVVFAAAFTRIPVISVALAAWLTVSFFVLAAIYWVGRLEIHSYLGTSASRVGTSIIIAGGVLSPLLLGLALRRETGEADSPPP